jgi:hypothetical protein
MFLEGTSRCFEIAIALDNFTTQSLGCLNLKLVGSSRHEDRGLAAEQPRRVGIRV